MNQIINASLDVHNEVIAKLPPIPSKCHYLFQLRDFSRIIKGMMLVASDEMKNSNDLCKLWTHEVLRVYADRLISISDQEVLYEKIQSAVKTNLSEICTKDFLEEVSTFFRFE